MRTILVPCDGSPASLRAVQYAVSLARELPGTKLVLLNVQEPALVREHAVRSSAELRETQAGAADHVLQAAARLAAAEHVPYETHWRAGAPADEIVRHAEEAGCTAIVMGTRGLGAIAGILLGSVAAKVLHGTSQPLTLIK